MITIPIYLYDQKNRMKVEAENERNENLGLPTKDVPAAFTVDFHMRESALSAFWVDPDEDDDTGTSNDINFYIYGAGYKSPYNKELVEKFTEILTNNK